MHPEAGINDNFRNLILRHDTSHLDRSFDHSRRQAAKEICYTARFTPPFSLRLCGFA